MRSWREERLKESGSMPAKKELSLSVATFRVRQLPVQGVRNSHDGAQGEQHQQSVPHGEVECAVSV